MQKITPNLWYDNQAEDAAKFYAATFPNSRVGSVTRYGEAGAAASGMPKGSAMTVTFELDGQQFVALNGGPVFKFSPAVSFFVSLESRDVMDEIWRKLVDDGSVLMPLDRYPFAERYGWLQDKYGVPWQLILAKATQRTKPCLLFVGERHGKAEEALKYYVSIFPDSNIERIERYVKGEQGTEGTVKHAAFSLSGQGFIAMESSMEHLFNFTEAISFIINCETQKEVDHYWAKLTSGGDEKAQQCGWLKDKYGVSWQVVPIILGKMMQDPDPVKAERVMKAMLPMKKLDIAALNGLMMDRGSESFDGRNNSGLS